MSRSLWHKIIPEWNATRCCGMSKIGCVYSFSVSLIVNKYYASILFVWYTFFRFASLLYYIVLYDYYKAIVLVFHVIYKWGLLSPNVDLLDSKEWVIGKWLTRKKYLRKLPQFKNHLPILGHCTCTSRNDIIYVHFTL